MQTQLYDNEEESWTENVPVPKARADEHKVGVPPQEFAQDFATVFEALRVFPQPKSLLTRIIQAATSSNRIGVGSSRGFFLPGDG